MNRSDLKPHQQMHKERSPSNFHIYDIAVYSKSDSVYHDLSVYNKRDYISHLMSYTNVLLFLCVWDECLSGIFFGKLFDTREKPYPCIICNACFTKKTM